MRWLLMILVTTSAACNDRRDFDERYNDTAAELQERANAIDANLMTNEAASGRPIKGGSPTSNAL